MTPLELIVRLDACNQRKVTLLTGVRFGHTFVPNNQIFMDIRAMDPAIATSMKIESLMTKLHTSEAFLVD